jgi:phage shock protein A
MTDKPEDLRGMGAADAKEYILNFISTLKLTEKKREALAADRAKWDARLTLARSRGEADLAAGAGRELERIRIRDEALAGEIGELQRQIAAMRRQLPGLAARERSIDPDLLEQELLIAAGRMPGEGDHVGIEEKMRDLEKENAAETALKALKDKIKGGP